MSSYTMFKTKLGWMAIRGSRAGLERIVLPQPSREAALALLGEAVDTAVADASPFGDLPQRLGRCLEGKPVVFTDRFNLVKATPFQQAVWQEASRIPHGETRSYGWVARRLGRPRAGRAVGQALAQNPLPLAIPCHRVVAAGGGLGGYGGGLELKRHLLEGEANLKTRPGE